MSSKTGPLMAKLYDTLREVFGNDEGALFQMEMPARLLEMGDYHYDGSDSINSQQVKPPAVAEAEFRLVDGMLNVSNLVGGPNGSKLSESYDEVLSSLSPTNIETNAALNDPDQQKIHDWLYEEVPNFDPPASDLLSMIPDDSGFPKKPEVIAGKKQGADLKKLRDPSQTPKIPRIDLYQKLLDTYEAERFRWEQFRNDCRPRDDDGQEKWDAYDRLLTTYAPIIDAKLEGLWAVVLVRGQYHRVKKYISYIDNQAASESLQQAKESFRASVTRSIDDTEDIYPVVLTPNNWAKYLATNLRLEDLQSEVNKTRDQLRDAAWERSLLTQRRDALIAESQDIKALEKAATDARNSLRDTQAAMVRGYTENAFSCIQLYFDVITKNAQNMATAIRGLTDKNKGELNQALAKRSEPPLSDEQWKSLIDMQARFFQNKANLATVSDALSKAQMAASSSQARGNDPSNAPGIINKRITALAVDIDYYQKILQKSDNSMGVPTAAELPIKPDRAPVAPPSQDGGGASIWQWLVIDSESSTQTSTNLSNTSVSQSDWSVDLWFGGTSGHKDLATDTSKKVSTSNTDIQIGFRAMKVTIHRPWFNAQLLGQSNEFMQYNANKISAGNPQDIYKTFSSGGIVDSSNCLLPSWTTAFIVVKDVHIVMTSQSTFTSSQIDDMKRASSSGGGFLCFQASKSSSGSEHRNSFSMKSDERKISIDIPAPQIIGWVSQLAPEDISVGS